MVLVTEQTIDKEQKTFTTSDKWSLILYSVKGTTGGSGVHVTLSKSEARCVANTGACALERKEVEFDFSDIHNPADGYNWLDE